MKKICWNVTSICNKKCKYCFRCNDEHDLSFDENVNILYKLKKMHIEKINWSGGEPTLYPKIKELFEISKKLGFINCMVTNASMITEENINTFFEFLDEVTFSIDFVDDSENEKYGRGSNYYAHVKEVIQLVNKKYPNCIVKINTVIMRQNVNQIDQIFNEIKQFKIAKWKLLQFSPLRGSAIINENEFSVEDVIYDNVAKKVQNFKSDFEINVHDFEHVKNSHVVISPARYYYRRFKSEVINTIDKNINLNLYKIFYEVAKCGSISAASKKLFVSQPAVSNSIRNLEEELNVKLFYRNLKGSELTEKGKELLYYIEEALNSLMMGERKMLEDDLFSNGKLSIGVPSHIGTFFIFDQIEKFHKLYPNIEITIISRATSELIDLLEKHEIDFVIDSLPIEPVYGNLVIKKLKTVPHCFFVTSDNENVKFEDINNLSDIADLPLILPVPRSYHRKKLNEKALELGIEFSNVLSIETSEMIIGAVKRNIGIGYVLRDLIRKDLDSGIYREIKLKEDLPKVEINIVYIEKFLSKVPKQYIEKFIESK